MPEYKINIKTIQDLIDLAKSNRLKVEEFKTLIETINEKRFVIIFLKDYTHTSEMAKHLERYRDSKGEPPLFDV
jgi:hypothetical protein